MEKGYTFLYYGDGRGKTTLAIGQGLRAVGEGLSVIFIQYLDYNNNKEFIPLKDLEPEFKVFRFEKMRDGVDLKNEEECREIRSEVMNGFHFSRKIMDTGECDMLILDGIVDAAAAGFLTEENISDLLERKPERMSLILTGGSRNETVVKLADYVYEIRTEKSPQLE
ncbi:MAG: cob(I)yrinic acid a,c-diamide adenosyltransferase [Clostridiales bacterium]|nr:cob(I)yrinic acid a,c-diamide adenosyltransferase [Clostridiales bacterium]